MFGDAPRVSSMTSLRFEVEAEDEVSWFPVPATRTHRTEYSVNIDSIAAVSSEVPSFSYGPNVNRDSLDNPLSALRVSGRVLGTFLELKHVARKDHLHVRLKGDDALVEQSKMETTAERTTDLQAISLAEDHLALDAVVQPGPSFKLNAKGADHAFSDAFLNEVSFGHAGSDRLVDKADTVNIHQIHLGHDVVSAGSGEEVMNPEMSEFSSKESDTGAKLETRWNGEDSDTFVWSGRKSSFQRQHNPGLNVKTAC